MPTTMTDAQLWASVVAFFLPLVIAVVQQPHWTRTARTAVAALFAIADGGLSTAFAGDFTGRSLVSCILLTIVVSGTSYKRLFEPIGLTGIIERRTALTRADIRRAA
jgi:hypothetical protein